MTSDAGEGRFVANKIQMENIKLQRSVSELAQSWGAQPGLLHFRCCFHLDFLIPHSRTPFAHTSAACHVWHMAAGAARTYS